MTPLRPVLYYGYLCDSTDVEIFRYITKQKSMRKGVRNSEALNYAE